MPFFLWIATFYTAASLTTLTAYGIDKRQATRGRRRISERTLHLMELAGGWPGAAVGQVIFRHKLRKLTYMLVFAAIILAHLAAWAGCIWMGWLP